MGLAPASPLWATIGDLSLVRSATSIGSVSPVHSLLKLVTPRPRSYAKPIDDSVSTDGLSDNHTVLYAALKLFRLFRSVLH